MWRFVRIIGWTVGGAVLLLLALPVVAYGPMVARCAQTAEDWLAEVPPALRSPPAALRDVLNAEFKQRHPANLITANLILNSGCSGWTPEHGHSHVIDELVMVFALPVWFSRDELYAIFTSRAYMGVANNHTVYGFDKAARAFYGRGIDELDASELACLARKTRAPNHPRYQCNGH
jgi:hypothetical protein